MRAPTAIFILATILAATSAEAKLLKTDQEIRNAIVGNTFSGEEDGEPYVEFLRPDGKLVGTDGDERYSGRWTISGGRICLSYDDERRKAAESDCSQVDLLDFGVKWVDEEGEETFSTLTPGNPHGL